MSPRARCSRDPLPTRCQRREGEAATVQSALNVQVNDSPSDSGSHHPSQECFMADTPEGHVQSGSGGDNPSATPNTGTAVDVHPQLLRQNPTPEQIRARQLEVAEAKRQLEHEH